MIEEVHHKSLQRLADSIRNLNSALIRHEGPTAIYAEMTDKVDSITGQLSGFPLRTRVYDKRINYRGPDRIPDITYGNQQDLSPVSGLSNPVAPVVNLKMIRENHVSGIAWFSSVYEGPPGLVHGGYIAAVFDETLGKVQAQLENPGMTGKLSVQYIRPCPVNHEYRLEGEIIKIEGRRIFTKASMNLDGKVMAAAKATFVALA
jgi:hypothetical protein